METCVYSGGCESTELAARRLCHRHYQYVKYHGRLGEYSTTGTAACAVCGADLPDVRDPRSMYCSDRCKWRSRAGKKPNEKACRFCGKSLAGKRVDAIYCDGVCSANARNAAIKVQVRSNRGSCVVCGTTLPLKRRLYCSTACKIVHRRPSMYGLSMEELAALEAQHDACAICGTTNWGGPHGRPCIDHDHLTGAVRGILCTNCNNGLGRFGDDPTRLRAAAEYLERSTT